MKLSSLFSLSSFYSFETKSTPEVIKEGVVPIDMSGKETELGPSSLIAKAEKYDTDNITNFL